MEVAKKESVAGRTQQDVFPVSCHCGRIRANVRIETSQDLWAWDCNCSDCAMRGNVHMIVPQQDLWIDDGSMQEPLEDATTLYQWGTKQAVRRFCKTCGILPWYTPRSNPDCYAVTIRCVDWTQGGLRSTPAPAVDIRRFDGVHWEETMSQLMNTK